MGDDPSLATAAVAAALAAVPISHPERVVYPDVGLTKLDIARYYAAMAPRMVPHVGRRPLTMMRCPQGLASKCFYQRHLRTGNPRYVHDVNTGGGKEDYCYVDAAAGLVALAQNGILELHTWGCRVDDLERPDVVVFDLDPAPDVEATQLVDSALEVGDLLGELGLRSFVKRTGGKGLHVVMPLTPRAGWDAVKGFAKGVAETLEAKAPKRYTANMSKAARGGKIYVDYVRNGRSSSAVAPYSTRARAGAPVALPVAWETLTPALLREPCSVAQATEALRQPDPWGEFFAVDQHLRA